MIRIWYFLRVWLTRGDEVFPRRMGARMAWELARVWETMR